MANTYSQCRFHLVFCPKNRDALIQKTWSNELEAYITGIITNHKHKVLAIKAMPDHVHIFIGYDLNQTIPKLVEEIKVGSNKWIKENKLCPFKFEWQTGYGAFTHSKSQTQTVINYINNQEEHHKKRSFKEEYLEILQNNDVTFDEKYLFEFFKDV